MNKIAIIIPWYGKLPVYFPFFLKGLEYNSTVLDVLFITDISVLYNLPHNFKIINLSWNELKDRIYNVLTKEPVLKHPYKLCDYKPLYGAIFEKEIEDYQFWGYGDIDLIYGNIKRFLPIDGINNYDVITFRENIIHGPFSLFKNNEYIRNLYKKTNVLNELVKNSEYIGFDEAGKRKEWRDGIRLYEKNKLNDFWDWTSIVQFEADNGNLKLFERYYCLEQIQSDCILVFNNGKLSINSEEFAFFHWVFHKKQNDFYIPFWEKVPDKFFIHKTGFYKKINLYFFTVKKLRNLSGRCLFIIKKFIYISGRIKNEYNTWSKFKHGINIFLEKILNKLNP